MPAATRCVQVNTTVPDRATADRVASVAVTERLAACAHVDGPLQSTYRWQGAVERADEWLLLIKTAADRYPAVEAAIRELHSYETPEIIATPIIAGSDTYLSWLRKETEQEVTEEAEKKERADK